ncbi:Mannose-6-phosphate isomerase [Methanosarcina barkeri 3]|uniref:Mannose-6-phosphate isomerase n=1 Tax=Methanosarcina barkeri 3 TaxID=1434107 RepID=A0A0E3SNL8_METBA|nr:cupin domain-containing protein [Methanosarcina barkeri]AKB82818.1 Mannose-6-phosphate isomerase [Methanosarcina barkeri 3]
MSLKNTLGILLAVCFLLSIAAVAVNSKEAPCTAGKETYKTAEKTKNKMKGFSINIENATLENNNFRKVLYTAKYSQLVLMSLKPGEEIGMEVHEGNDQFFRFEEGQGKCIINGNEYEVGNGSAVVVPAGAQHNVINTLETGSLKFYVIYSPPVHKDQTTHATKEEAEANPDTFDGVTTECNQG